MFQIKSKEHVTVRIKGVKELKEQRKKLKREKAQYRVDGNNENSKPVELL